MSNVIQLVKPLPPEPTKAVYMTWANVLELMSLLEDALSMQPPGTLDAQVYPQLQRLHAEFLDQEV